MTIDPRQIAQFEKSIILSHSETQFEQGTNGYRGQLRFNNTINKFEGYHTLSNPDPTTGSLWRPLTQDIASGSNLGVIRVGTNLVINPITGILSSIATGTSQFYEFIISVSPYPGAADYQNINTAITTAIGTPAGGYIDGSLTSNIGSPPSAQYPFVIELGPGQYTEAPNQIVLPDWVTLRGQDCTNSIINLNVGGATPLQGALIVTGNSCIISKVTLNLNDVTSAAYSTGIYGNNVSNVTVDCVFIQTAPTNSSTLATTGVSLTNGTNNRIMNSQFKLENVQGYVSAINITNSIPIITNNTILINTTQTFDTGVGIKIINTNGINTLPDTTLLQNNSIAINYNTTANPTTSIGVLLTDTTPASLIENNIECAGDPTTSQNYGVQIYSTGVVTSVSSTVISFVSIGTGLYNFDYILSNNTGVVNFITAGFFKGQVISVTGSLYNNRVYRIQSVTSSQLVLEPQYKLITENAGGALTITIDIILDCYLKNNTITGTTYPIIQDSTTPTVVTANLVLGDNILKGGDPSYAFTNIIYTQNTVITVGAENCDYKLVSDALNSISQSSQYSPFTIKVTPGIYNEPVPIIGKPYVDIIGDGTDNTIINCSQYDTSAGAITQAGAAIVLASNMILQGFTINNDTTMSGVSQTAAIFYSNGQTNYSLKDLNLSINASGNIPFTYALFSINDTKPILTNINAQVNGNTQSIGYQFNNTTNVQIDTNNIKCLDTSTIKNICIEFTNSAGTIINTTVDAENSVGVNLSLNTYSTDTTQRFIQIFGGTFTALDAVAYSIYCDNYYTIACMSGTLLQGDTFTNSTSSYLKCNGAYTFSTPNDPTSFQSLNSRGENEQALGTITVGDTAGNLNSTGTENTFVGVDSGTSITSGSHNTAVGYATAASLTTQNDNTCFGYKAGNSLAASSTEAVIIGSNTATLLIDSTSDTIIGANTALGYTTGGQNTIIGADSATMLDNSGFNVMVGNSVGTTITNDLGSTYVGTFCAQLASNTAFNAFYGVQAGYAAQGSYDTYIGPGAGIFATSNETVSVGILSGANSNAKNNTFLGSFAGSTVTTGECNTFVGNKAGSKGDIFGPYTTGSFNVAIGSEAGSSIIDAYRNILIGTTTDSTNTANNAPGWSLVSGTDNVMIGISTGYTANNTVGNVLIGSNVGPLITSAGNNIFIGKDTGIGTTNQGSSIIIGAGAGQATNVGNVLMMGINAGAQNSGALAMAIGNNAGYNVTGSNNMFIGYNSGGYTGFTTSGDYNVAMGPYTGFYLTGGARNVLIGGGSNTQAVGRQLTTGSDNTLLGFVAGNALTTGSDNTLVGSNAGANLTLGVGNLILGYKSSFNLSTGQYNISLGNQAAYSQTTGDGNINIGYQSGFNNISASNNVNVGYQSGYTNITGANNIHMGYQSGFLSTASNNLFFGYQSGVKNTLGTNNIFVGTASGAGNNVNNRQIGNNNIFMGQNSGNANESGTQNLFLGTNTGSQNLAGTKNIFIGPNAGSQSETSQNIFIGSASDNAKGIGYLSNPASRSGQYNVFVGTDVGIANTDGDYNIFLGYQAGKSNNGGRGNIYVGRNAGLTANSSSASDNIAVGTLAAQFNTTGERNIVMGYQAAAFSTNAYSQNIIVGTNAGQQIDQDNQIFIGTNAGEINTTGDRNVFIGYYAGSQNLVSCDNVVIGSNAAVLMTGVGTTGNNTIIGSNAGKNMITGVDNIYLGSAAGQNAVTGDNNVAIGANVMSIGDSSNVVIIGNRAGQNNNAEGMVAIGFLAGNANTTGPYNIFVGQQAGYLNTTGANNIYMGVGAGATNTSGNINVCIGTLAGQYNSSSGSILVGYQAGLVNQANNNIMIGSSSGLNNTTGFNNIFMGTNTGEKTTTGASNIFIGNQSGNKNATGNNNVFMGAFAGSNTSNVSSCVIIGTSAGTNNRGDGNVFIGDSSGSSNTTGTGGIMIGRSAGRNVPGTSLNNIFVGDSCGRFSTGNSAVFIGVNAGYSNRGNDNIYLGLSSGYQSNGNVNIGIGSYAGQNNTGNNCVFIGSATGLNNLSDENIFIGSQAGYSNTSGLKNTFLGQASGTNTTTGSFNLFLGSETGWSNTTGNLNICIGYFAGRTMNSNANIFIGSYAGYNTTTGTNNSFIGFNTGLNNTTGFNNFCLGSLSGYFNVSGYGNTFIGTNTGYNNTGNANTYIGNNVGQVNDGDKNIFFGYERETIVTSSSSTETTYSNKFSIYNSANHGITSNTTANCTVLIGGDFTTGTVGIGTLIPDSFVGTTISNTNTALVVLGKVLANAYTTFTGTHYIKLADTIDFIPAIGLIMSSTGLTNTNTFNNFLPEVTLSNKVNDKAVFGVYAGSEILTNGELNHFVNSLGEGHIWICNINGEVQNGDYITTSPIAGYGYLQADDILHSYTVAKCCETIDWNSIPENISYQGINYKSLLVACTYHCG